MLQRRMIVVPLLLLFLTTTGCTLFRFIDNSSPEEMQKFAASKDELWNKARALEDEKAANQRQLAEQQAEIDRINRDLVYWQNETARADGRVVELSKTVENLNAQAKPRQETVQAAPMPPKEAVPERKPSKIKVLAGNGDIASARSLSKRLGKMGYPVKLIDKAPRSDFKAHTIFFAPGYQTAAATLAKQLGKGAISKPLTWQSIFNIIIVTGHSS
jgi:septal ring factor EnvC (AmiA/AmiB activator)